MDICSTSYGEMLFARNCSEEMKVRTSPRRAFSWRLVAGIGLALILPGCAVGKVYMELDARVTQGVLGTMYPDEDCIVEDLMGYKVLHVKPWQVGGICNTLLPAAECVGQDKQGYIWMVLPYPRYVSQSLYRDIVAHAECHVRDFWYEGDDVGHANFRRFPAQEMQQRGHPEALYYELVDGMPQRAQFLVENESIATESSF